MNHPHPKSAVEQSRSDGHGVDKGPLEAAGESIGSATAFVANRAGVGYRSATSDYLSQRSGAFIGGAFGRAVETLASNTLSAGKFAAQAALDDLFEYQPKEMEGPQEMERPQPKPRPRLRPKREET